MTDYIEVKDVDRNILTNPSTGLSPGLARGEIDPRDLLQEINYKLASRSLNMDQSCYLEEVKRQLIMREFARSALEIQVYRVLPGARRDDDPMWRRLYNGETSIPVLDACVRALKSGLPHNRARLLLAREAIRRYNVDPEIVADWFREYLDDYSPVINTFNIVVAASAITAGEPWFRRSNPFTAAKRLDPKGEFQRKHGFEPRNKPTADEKTQIGLGSAEWLHRWQSTRIDGYEFETRKLWPTRDEDKGIYFIYNRISARGAFSHYYRKYLMQEEDLLK